MSPNRLYAFRKHTGHIVIRKIQAKNLVFQTGDMRITADIFSIPVGSISPHGSICVSIQRLQAVADFALD